MPCVKRERCSNVRFLSAHLPINVRFLRLAFYRCANSEAARIALLFCETLAFIRFHLFLYSTAIKETLLLGRRNCD